MMFRACLKCAKFHILLLRQADALDTNRDDETIAGGEIRVTHRHGGISRDNHRSQVFRSAQARASWPISAMTNLRLAVSVASIVIPYSRALGLGCIDSSAKIVSSPVVLELSSSRGTLASRVIPLAIILESCSGRRDR